jgi:hypothetical protein
MFFFHTMCKTSLAIKLLEKYFDDELTKKDIPTYQSHTTLIVMNALQ